jgi:hypothetical protein
MTDDVRTATPISLVTLVVASAVPPPAQRDEVMAWLTRRWDTVRSAGMDEPDDGLPLEPVSIDPDDDQWIRFLAACRASDGSGRAGRYFRLHDVLGVLARIPYHDPAEVVPDLVRSDGEERPVAAFGQARLVVAHAPCPADLDPADTLRPFDLARDDSQLFATVTADGSLITEIEDPAWRTFAVIVPEANRGWVDNMTWTRPGPELGSFIRYLVHAAKLRYEVAVFKHELPGLRKREKRLDQTLSGLFQLHTSLDRKQARLDRSLSEAHDQLSQAHAESAELVVSASFLRDLRRSVQMAADNIKVHVPDGARSPDEVGLTSFDRDVNLAKWVTDQAEQELGYLDSARERVAAAQRLTALRLNVVRREQDRLANWLTVLQTSVVGAVIGGLAVIEAFQPTMPSGDALVWPVLVTVSMLSLLLPPLALRWATGLGRFDFLAGAACGAALGWIAATATGWNGLWTAVAIVLGGIPGAWLLRWRYQLQRS